MLVKDVWGCLKTFFSESSCSQRAAIEATCGRPAVFLTLSVYGKEETKI